MGTSIFNMNDFYRHRIELAIKLEILREGDLGISEDILNDDEDMDNFIGHGFMDESGKLCIRKKGDRYRFYRRKPLRKGYDDKYISETSIEALRLAAKTMIQQLRDDVEREIQFLNQLLNIRTKRGLTRAQGQQAINVQRIGLTIPDFEDEFLQKMLGYEDSERTKLMRQGMALCRALSQKNPKYREYCDKETKAGYWVRSKSEKDIANALYDENIPFCYEPHMVFDGIDFYPDFVLIRLDGSYVIWEHRGLDKPSYIEEGYQKLRIYNKHGYYMNNNLVYTYEHDVKRLSQILKIIMRFYYVW